jgi:hypothetical protein
MDGVCDSDLAWHANLCQEYCRTCPGPSTLLAPLHPHQQDLHRGSVEDSDSPDGTPRLRPIKVAKRRVFDTNALHEKRPTPNAQLVAHSLTQEQSSAV